MNGKELYEAMSFVDEAYIQEAEMPARRHIRWQPFAAMAACLGLVIVGWQILLAKQTSITGAATMQSSMAMKAEEAPEIAFAAEAIEDEAPMMQLARALPQLTVQVISCEDGILLCTVTDSGTTEYPAGTELRIAAPIEDAAEGDSFLISIFPEAGEGEALHALEILPVPED